MKHSAPDGGELTRFAQLRAALVVVATALSGITLAALAEEPKPQELDFLAPAGFIAGGFQATPSRLPGQSASGRYFKFGFPAAIAANGPDIYFADIGQGLLLRVDSISRAVTPLRELRPLPGVRLETDRDGSVYVIEPGRAIVERIARDGRRLSLSGDKFDILQPADVAVAPDGRLWLSDTAGGVFAFHSSGREGHPLIGRGDGFAGDSGGATLLAAGQHEIYGYDPNCRCIGIFDRDGAPIGTLAGGDLLNPVDIEVDIHNRVWVLDHGDHQLKIFDAGHLIASLRPARLGMADINGIAIDANQAFLSDGPGGKIAIFVILAPTHR